MNGFTSPGTEGLFSIFLQARWSGRAVFLVPVLNKQAKKQLHGLNVKATRISPEASGE